VILAKYSELCWVGGLLATSAILFLCVGGGGWPGAVHECVALASCYCEAPRPGLIAQPSNTWSCLGWAAAGFWIAWDAARRRERDTRPEETPGAYKGSFYTGLYALIVVSLVPGGMFFHASLTDWGGKLDILSMYLLVNFWIFYNLAHWFEWSNGRFLVSYLASTTVLLVPRVIFSAVEIGLLIFVGLILFALVVEIRIHRTRHRRWVWIGLVAFGVAHVVQVALPCDPRSLFQPHAVLHLIEVITLIAFYFHFFVEHESLASADMRTG
jgi:hypothetical protein